MNLTLNTMFIQIILSICSFRIGKGQMIKPFPNNKRSLSEISEDSVSMDVSGVTKPLDELDELTIQVESKGRILTFVNKGSRFAYFYGEAEDGSFISMVEDTRKNGQTVYTGSIHDALTGEVNSIKTDADLNTIVTGRSSKGFDPEGHGPEEEDREEEKGGDRNLFRSAIDSRYLQDDDGSVLDVMVLWSINAECRQSGKKEGCSVNSNTKDNMRSFIQLAIEQTNTAFEKSGIETSVRLVRSYREYNYEESRDFSYTYAETLDSLRLDGDGEMDDVHQYRAEYRADIVVMLIEQTGLCGYAIKGPGPSLMFSVVEVGCAVDNMSFAHEIGHCLGLKHDQGAQGECDTTDYNFGYRDPKGVFRTIMAIDCEYSSENNECDDNPSYDCPKILRFSTPDPQYTKNGELVGSETANAARHINEVAYEVANYYKSQGPPPTMAPTPPISCSSSSDCIDNNECTLNSCRGGTCFYESACSRCGSVEARVEITTDHYPTETSWKILDSDRSVMKSFGPYDEEGSYTHSVCLESGSYEFEITDIEDDGICCEWGEGSYMLLVDDEVIGTGGKFETSEILEFII